MIRTSRVLISVLLIILMLPLLFSCRKDPPSTVPIDPATFVEGLPTYKCPDGSVLSTYYRKSADDFRGVCTYYESIGYSVYSTSDMGGNLSATYVKDGKMAHIYWHPATDVLNLVQSSNAASLLPPSSPSVTDGDYECSIVQLQDSEHANGMAYIIQLKDGSYIIYDGGWASQAEKIENYILENWHGEGKPTVRAWVLTHSHIDHYQAFTEVAANSKWNSKFSVEYIIYSPVDKSYAIENHEKYFNANIAYDILSFSGAKVVFAHTGMKFKFCNLTMEILYAPESYYKSTTVSKNFNNTSIVSRLYDDNYSALFNADIALQGATVIERLYGDYLKSNVCQIAHHGVEDVPLSYYEHVQAAILYYPCSRALYDQTSGHWDVRKAMEGWDCTKEILIAELGQYKRVWGTSFDESAELSIPDY